MARCISLPFWSTVLALGFVNLLACMSMQHGEIFGAKAVDGIWFPSEVGDLLKGLQEADFHVTEEDMNEVLRSMDKTTPGVSPRLSSMRLWRVLLCVENLSQVKVLLQ